MSAGLEDTVCLSVSLSVATVLLLSMPDRIDGRRSIERDPLGSAGGDLSCLVGGQTANASRTDTDGGGIWRKKESEFLPFPSLPALPSLCLPCLGFLAASIWSGQVQGTGRGQGLWLHCALSLTGTLLCNAIYG